MALTHTSERLVSNVRTAHRVHRADRSASVGQVARGVKTHFPHTRALLETRRRSINIAVRRRRGGRRAVVH